MRPATSSFFVNKLVFTSTPASTSGTGYSASTSGSSLTRGVYRTKLPRRVTASWCQRIFPLSPALPSGQTLQRDTIINTVARPSRRAASAGDHHGEPRRATRRSHPDSPGGAAKRAGHISWWSPWRTSPGHTQFPSGISGAPREFQKQQRGTQ